MNHEQSHDQPQQPEHDLADPERAPTPGPQIWVASLSDYNDGTLHGAWLDAAREVEAIHADIQAMLAASPLAAETGQPAEEWGIFDFEGFGAFRLAEYENLEVVSRIACGIAEHGLAYAAFAEVMDGDPDTLAGFTDAYRGHYDSVEAYAEEFAEGVGYYEALERAVPEAIRPYIRLDIEAMAHEMQIGGVIHVLAAEGGGVWIFRGDT